MARTWVVLVTVVALVLGPAVVSAQDADESESGSGDEPVETAAPSPAPAPAPEALFVAIDPVRAYDSRWFDGPLTVAVGAGVISVSDGRDVLSGAVTVPDAVPVGATSVTFVLTVTDTVGAGFVTATPGDATTFGSSTVNWFESGQTFANGSTVKISAARQVKLWAGGVPWGSTQVVFDITGYHIPA